MKQNKDRTSLRTQHGFWILLVAAVVLETIICIQFFTSRRAIRDEAVQRAHTELRSAELEINVVTAELEAAVRMLAMMAENSLSDPRAIYSCTHTLLATLDNVESAGIAFTANYFPQYGQWYEICSSRLVGDSIYTRQIGGPDHDYLATEWFGNGLSIDSTWWCEPYMDNSGAGTMVVSCTYPVRDQNGTVVAVACVDLSLNRLYRVSEYLQVYKDSYYSIQSSTGIDIVAKPDTTPGRKYLIFDEEIDATGWHLSIIIPEDILYADLERIGLLVTLLMLLGLAVLLFIMYRSLMDMKALMQINGQKERMMGELETARNIQMAILPKSFPPYPHRPDLSMYGVVLPAKAVGGDLYDFYERDGKLLFCIGDVSGKGMPAAIVMAMTCSLFRAFSAHEDDMAHLAAQINEAMSQSNEMSMFVTLFLGSLDLQSGELHYCNAGHNAPLLNAQPLPVLANLPVGIEPGYNYTAQTATLRRGDTLFLYTDGLTEAENKRHELFGEQRMISSLTDHESAQQEVDTMLQAVHSFVDEAEQSDDLTMLVIKWLRHSIVMRNDIEQIPTLTEWIESLHIPQELNMPINLALEEAVTNVMLYAYPNSHGKVIIEADISDTQLCFVVSDTGIPFDPTQKPEADISLSAEEREIGGLGIHLVRQLMDEIHYVRKDNTNILTLVKKL